MSRKSKMLRAVNYAWGNVCQEVYSRTLRKELEVEFRQVKDAESPEIQTELYTLVIKDLDVAVQKMIEICSENGVSFTADEVRAYLEAMSAENEFDDIELDEAALAAVSGGFFKYLGPVGEFGRTIAEIPGRMAGAGPGHLDS